MLMTQDERWSMRYKEVVDFIEANHRNPSKYVGEERNMYTFVKHCRKQMNQSLLKEDRKEAFKKFLVLMDKHNRVNQYQ